MIHWLHFYVAIIDVRRSIQEMIMNDTLSIKNTVFLIAIYISKLELLKYWYQSTHLISRYQRHWTSILQLFVSQYLYPVWSPYFPLFIWLFIKCIHFFSSSINHGHGRRIIGRKFMENWCLIFTMRNVVSLSFGR